MPVVYPGGGFHKPPQLRIVGIDHDQLDPVHTAKHKLYSMPIKLSRNLTEFEEEALAAANPFPFELRADVLWIHNTSVDDMVANEGGRTIANALHLAVEAGEAARADVTRERARLETIGKRIDFTMPDEY